MSKQNQFKEVNFDQATVLGGGRKMSDEDKVKAEAMARASVINQLSVSFAANMVQGQTNFRATEVVSLARELAAAILDAGA